MFDRYSSSSPPNCAPCGSFKGVHSVFSFPFVFFFCRWCGWQFDGKRVGGNTHHAPLRVWVPGRFPKGSIVPGWVAWRSNSPEEISTREYNILRARKVCFASQATNTKTQFHADAFYGNPTAPLLSPLELQINAFHGTMAWMICLGFCWQLINGSIRTRKVQSWDTRRWYEYREVKINRQ
jgi:hypothetical protein